MKTLRFELPVLASTDVPALLDLVTRVDGVIAGLVRGSTLEVIVTREESGLLLRQRIVEALAAGAYPAS